MLTMPHFASALLLLGVTHLTRAALPPHILFVRPRLPWVFATAWGLVLHGAGAACRHCVAAADPRRYLQVLSDDFGYNDASFHGSEIQTPFLDSLNKAGVELRNYYGHMICTPSRSAVMSGRYAFNTGMQHSYWGTGQDGGLPLKFKTMANHLSELGYSTHMVGKVSEVW